MADKPHKNEDKTPAPATDDKGELLHPDGMNPHIVPEGTSGEEQTTDDK
jgi:hypothetical protein